MIWWDDTNKRNRSQIKKGKRRQQKGEEQKKDEGQRKMTRNTEENSNKGTNRKSKKQQNKQQTKISNSILTSFFSSVKPPLTAGATPLPQFGTLQVSGYLRGGKLNVDNILHITGYGDAQMETVRESRFKKLHH